jgi:hypothetical protein
MKGINIISDLIFEVTNNIVYPIMLDESETNIAEETWNATRSWSQDVTTSSTQEFLISL